MAQFFRQPRFASFDYDTAPGSFPDQTWQTRGASTPLGPPTRAELERLTALTVDYGYWLGSPQDNAAVGLVLG
jgi:hypothetical protein